MRIDNLINKAYITIIAANLAFAQLASVTGWTGITSIVGWVASVVNRFWESNAKGPKRYPGFMYCGATIAIILIFGNARLWKSYGGDSVRAALVVGESTLPEEGELRSDVLKYLKGEPLTDGKFTSARAHVRKVINRNFQLAENALQAGAKFVVFPEENPAITPYDRWWIFFGNRSQGANDCFSEYKFTGGACFAGRRLHQRRHNCLQYHRGCFFVAMYCRFYDGFDCYIYTIP